jgi:hypothetical protein
VGAGHDRRVLAGVRVRLDGSSTRASQRRTRLGLRWTIIARPKGSKARLLGRGRARPTLVTDVPGQYTVQLRARQLRPVAGHRDRARLPQRRDPRRTRHPLDRDPERHAPVPAQEHRPDSVWDQLRQRRPEPLTELPPRARGRRIDRVQTEHWNVLQLGLQAGV